MLSAMDPSFISALLNAQANGNNAFAGLNTPSQSFPGLPTNPMQGGSNNVTALDILRNSALLAQLMQKQQAEEQQRTLLVQQLAALGGLTPNNVLGNSLDMAGLAGTLLQLQNQQRQQNTLRGLMELQASLGFQGGNQVGVLPSVSAPATPRVSAGTDNLSGLSALTSQAEKMDRASLAKLVDQVPVQVKEVKPPHPSPRSSPKTEGVAAVENSAPLPLPPDRKRKGRTGTFPQKLHQMLSDLEREDDGSSIASFLPHGSSFAIHKPREFAKSVMPKYFRMSRFSSFQRQLNLYDFNRVTEGCDKGSYCHDLFVKDRPVLCTMMKRNKIKGVKRNSASVSKVTESTKSNSDTRDSDDGSSEDNAESDDEE